MVLGAVIVGFAFLGAWLARQPWRFRIELSGREADFRLALGVRWLGGSWTASWPLSLPDLGGSAGSSGGDPSSRERDEGSRGASRAALREIFGAVRVYATVTDSVRKRTDHIETWADADVGLSDAALTALLVGVCWSGLGLWTAQLGGRTAPASPYRVRPSFDRQVLAASLGGIFHVTAVDIIHGIWLAFRRARHEV